MHWDQSHANKLWQDPLPPLKRLDITGHRQDTKPGSKWLHWAARTRTLVHLHKGISLQPEELCMRGNGGTPVDKTDCVELLYKYAGRGGMMGMLTSTPRVKMMLELKAGMVKAPKYLMPSPVKIWAPALNHTGSCMTSVTMIKTVTRPLWRVVTI